MAESKTNPPSIDGLWGTQLAGTRVVVGDYFVIIIIDYRCNYKFSILIIYSSKY